MNENIKAQIARELTVEAMKSNLIKIAHDDSLNSEAVGQHIAKVFNAILKNVQC